MQGTVIGPIGPPSETSEWCATMTKEGEFVYQGFTGVTPYSPWAAVWARELWLLGHDVLSESFSGAAPPCSARTFAADLGVGLMSPEAVGPDIVLRAGTREVDPVNVALLVCLGMVLLRARKDRGVNVRPITMLGEPVDSAEVEAAIQVPHFVATRTHGRLVLWETLNEDNCTAVLGTDADQVGKVADRVDELDRLRGSIHRNELMQELLGTRYFSFLWVIEQRDRLETLLDGCAR